MGVGTKPRRGTGNHLRMTGKRRTPADKYRVGHNRLKGGANGTVSGGNLPPEPHPVGLDGFIPTGNTEAAGAGDVKMGKGVSKGTRGKPVMTMCPTDVAPTLLSELLIQRKQGVGAGANEGFDIHNGVHKKWLLRLIAQAVRAETDARAMGGVRVDQSLGSPDLLSTGLAGLCLVERLG